MKLRDVTFGKSDGYNESLEPNFSEMFYEDTGSYQKLLDTRNYIIIGRKGTGKTTLASYYKYKSNLNKNEICDQRFANDFIQKKLLNFAQEDINKDETSLFWEYVFLLDLGAELVKFYRKRRFLSVNKLVQSNKIKELEKILKNEQTRIDNITSSTSNEDEVSSGFTAGKKSSLTLNGNSKYTSSETLSKRRAIYYEEQPNLKKLVFELLKKSKQKIVLFYDDMDQFEEFMDLLSFKSLMKHMIYSADKLNHELYSFKSTKICLVFREDIVEMMNAQANNLNKQITDSKVEISWFDTAYSEPWEHPLMQMILYKIKKSQPNNTKNLEEIYTEMFDRNVFEFLMERSFGRPRDLIQYLNLYKDEFPEDEKIIIKKLLKVEQKYSKWFYNEILNELSISQDKEAIAQVIDIISARGYVSFTEQQIVNYINTTSFQLVPNLSETLGIMTSTSILGLKINGKNTVFAYRIGYPTKAQHNSKFIVNNGIRKFLSLG
ncbi:hypothetical protein LO769_04525 [Lactococcus lactis subsp. lactis]|uniref:P-loop ATPase, Sll1717 family n=1 Tax=Lactococcus lactis TaxID=1358 RepID=UPI002078852D|nr:hypothetical protein [Lactococcus lactis]USI63884.1 hypothetical protein LO769_04525 [Lactococcus lactis subsp. lactis]